MRPKTRKSITQTQSKCLAGGVQVCYNCYNNAFAENFKEKSNVGKGWNEVCTMKTAFRILAVISVCSWARTAKTIVILVLVCINNLNISSAVILRGYK